jgi:hypothetical protein
MLSAAQIHYYNGMVEREEIHNVIKCPMDPMDIVTTKIDEDDEIYFFCISCKTKFTLSYDAKEFILQGIDKSIKQR